MKRSAIPLPCEPIGMIGTARVAEITGFTIRWVQMHAREIPSAVQYFEGGEWRFDEAAVRMWKDEKAKKATAWRTSIKEAKRGGGASITRPSNSANRLRQILNL